MVSILAANIVGVVSPNARTIIAISAEESVKIADLTTTFGFLAVFLWKKARLSRWRADEKRARVSCCIATLVS
jgi:hypothetical protein